MAAPAKARRVIAADVKRMQDGPSKVEGAVKNTAHADGTLVRIRIPQDPGQAGKAQKMALIGALAGYSVTSEPATGDKVTRFSPFSTQAEAGNVDLVAGLPEEFLRALEAFPDAGHDDDADATAEAFAGHLSSHTGFLEYARRQTQETAEAHATARANLPGPGGTDVVEPKPEVPKGRNAFGLSAGAKSLTDRQTKKPPTVAELDAARSVAKTPPGEWPG